jgi:co-chaperonin GroES (HSP10)
MERMELNSNEKLALKVNGMEGNGKHFVVNGVSADQTLAKEKQAKLNSTIDSYVEKFDNHAKTLEHYANKISETINGLEIMPMTNHVLVKPFEKNPFQQIKVTESGIITDLGGMTPEVKSNETGQLEEEQQFIKVGTVIETGPKCEFLKEGDVVFFTVASEMMVPFFRQGFVVVNENRIIAVVNEGLTNRKWNIQHGSNI